jgi:hypothetical protein
MVWSSFSSWNSLIERASSGRPMVAMNSGYVNHLEGKRPTIAQVFDEYIPAGVEHGSPRPINLDNVIVKNAGYWSNSTLDLVPSRLELSLRTTTTPSKSPVSSSIALLPTRTDRKDGARSRKYGNRRGYMAGTSSRTK